MIVVVMGPSGSGKTVIGTTLAARMGVPFLEGDALHPTANVVKMRGGQPLEDADRAPWFDAIATWIARHTEGVVACSALKRTYRDRLRVADPALVCVLLRADRATLAARVAARRGHFMPPALVESQRATLEPLGADEAGTTIANIGPIDAVVDAIVARLTHLGGAHTSCA